jgi:hypothetical protein
MQRALNEAAASFAQEKHLTNVISELKLKNQSLIRENNRL